MPVGPDARPSPSDDIERSVLRNGTDGLGCHGRIRTEVVPERHTPGTGCSGGRPGGRAAGPARSAGPASSARVAPRATNGLSDRIRSRDTPSFGPIHGGSAAGGRWLAHVEVDLRSLVARPWPARRRSTDPDGLQPRRRPSIDGLSLPAQHGPATWATNGRRERSARSAVRPSRTAGERSGRQPPAPGTRSGLRRRIRARRSRRSGAHRGRIHRGRIHRAAARRGRSRGSR